MRHLYGISVAESQTFLLAKRPSAAMSEEKRLPFAGYGCCSLLVDFVFELERLFSIQSNRQQRMKLGKERKKGKEVYGKGNLWSVTYPLTSPVMA